jgi:hypothetical protein
MTTPVPSLRRSRRPAAAPDAPWADRLAGPVFAGRDRELAELDGLLALAAAGAGQVALIEGEPGLGKSALPRALFDLERARCLARGRNRPAALARLRAAHQDLVELGAAPFAAAAQAELAALGLRNRPAGLEREAARPAVTAGDQPGQGGDGDLRWRP